MSDEKKGICMVVLKINLKDYLRTSMYFTRMLPIVPHIYMIGEHVQYYGQFIDRIHMNMI